MDAVYYSCPFCKQKIRFFENRTKTYCGNCSKEISRDGVRFVEQIKNMYHSGHLSESIHEKVIASEYEYPEYACAVASELVLLKNEPLFWHLLYYFSNDNTVIQEALTKGCQGMNSLGKNKCMHGMANALHYGKYGFLPDRQGAFFWYSKLYENDYKKAEIAYIMAEMVEQMPTLSDKSAEYYYNIARDLGYSKYGEESSSSDDFDLPPLETPLSDEDKAFLDDFEESHLLDFLHSLGGAE